MGILICLISVNNRGCTAVAIFLIALILLVWVLIKMNDHIPIEPHLPCHVAICLPLELEERRPLPLYCTEMQQISSKI